MKKIIFPSLFFISCQASYSQNVGIGINTPLAPLHIKKNLEALRIEGTTPYISFYNNAGTIPKAFMQNTGDNLFLGTSTGNTSGITQVYTNGAAIMTMLPTGYIGIGTSAPANKLTVQTLTNDFGLTHTDGTITVGSWIGNFGGTTGGWFGTKNNYPLHFFTNNGGAQMTILPNGNIGIGTIASQNKLQIGNSIPGFSGYDFTIGNGTQAIGFFQGSDISYWTSSTNISFIPKSGTGNLGINTYSPANKLQIGSVGGTGFNGNDLAIGNGSQAMVIYQSAASTLLASTTDIILKPRNNGQGRVGINTTTPRAPLDVADGIGVTALAGFYSYLNFSSFLNGTGSSTSNPVPNVSIVASGRMYADEFDAYSDARIKNVIGISNAANDLEAINALQITDYTMKDKVKYGDRTFKKVIAQDVEKIYPQVISKHGNFIPNVYQATTQAEKVAAGYLLTFINKHTISNNAKKLRVLLSETEAMQVVDIISIPSGTQVIINVTDIKLERIFVYGEEVDDFRTVDYEGLTTLNISATQELSRLVKKQEQHINQQNKKIARLVAVVKFLERKTMIKQPLN